jgi:hypothetical protein
MAGAGGAGGYEFADSDAEAVVANFPSAPGDTYNEAIDTLVAALKTAGVWAEMDLFYVLAASASGNAKINWKSPAAGTFDLTENGVGLTFTADVGFTSDGASYLETNWDPSTNGSTFTRNDAHASIGISKRNDTGLDRFFEAQTGGSTDITGMLDINNEPARQTRIGLNNSTAGFDQWEANGDAKIGNRTISRTTGTAGSTIYYVDGVTRGEEDTTGTATDPLTTGDLSLFRGLGATCQAGVQLTYFSIGGALNATQVSGFHDAMEAYFQAIGTVANTEASAIIDAMTTAPSGARRRLVDATVGELISTGLWAEMDICYFMAAATEQASRLNWKAPTGSFNLVATNSPTFTADVGWDGDGSTAYLDTNWDPTNDGSTFTQDDCSIGVRHNATADHRLRLTGDGGLNAHYTTDGPNDDPACILNQGNVGTSQWTEAGDDASGLWVLTRNGSATTDLTHYVNGVSRGQRNNASSAATSGLGSSDVFFLRVFVNEAADGDVVSYGHWGGNMSAGQVERLDVIVDDYIAGL